MLYTLSYRVCPVLPVARHQSNMWMIKDHKENHTVPWVTSKLAISKWIPTQTLPSFELEVVAILIFHLLHEVPSCYSPSSHSLFFYCRKLELNGMQKLVWLISAVWRVVHPSSPFYHHHQNHRLASQEKSASHLLLPNSLSQWKPLE